MHWKLIAWLASIYAWGFGQLFIFLGVIETFMGNEGSLWHIASGFALSFVAKKVMKVTEPPHEKT